MVVHDVETFRRRSPHVYKSLNRVCPYDVFWLCMFFVVFYFKRDCPDVAEILVLSCFIRRFQPLKSVIIRMLLFCFIVLVVSSFYFTSASSSTSGK